MAAIKDIWFEGSRIYMRTEEGRVYSRPLEAFPLLKEAGEDERQDFKIGRFGDSVRWEKLDEDIHISNFYEDAEPDYDNEIALIFKELPQLDVAEAAAGLEIHRTLLLKYIYGIKKPNEKISRRIKEYCSLQINP